MNKKPKLKKELILEVTQLQERVTELEAINDEQIHALDVLQESERQFRTIFTDAAIGINTVDIEGSPILSNRALQEILGYSDDELRRMVFTDYTHQDDIEENLRLVQEVREGKRDHFIIDKRYIQKDGTVVWAHTSVSGLRDAKGNLQYFITMVEDITERVQAEDLLKESERQLKEAQEFGRIGRWEYDIDSQKITWSDQVFKLFERDPSLGEPSPKEEATYYPPEDSARLREYSRRAIKEGKSFEYDFQVQLPSGKTSYMAALMRPITDERGRVIKLVGTVQDITERKQVEKELEDIFSLSPDMVGVFNTEGKLLKVNLAWEKILGYKRNELLDLGWVELVHPDDVEETNKEVEKQLKGGSTVNFINRYKCKDGSYKTLEWQATYAKEGVVYATARDITERKQAEQAIRESETRIRNLMETVPIGISKSTPEGNVLEANPAMLKIFGYDSKEEFINIPSAAHYKNSKDRKQFVKLIKKGSVKNFELQYKRKDGSIFWGSTTSSLVTTEAGNIEFINTLTDITERMQAEEELRESESKYKALHNEAQRFRDALDKVPSYVYIKDIHSCYTYGNQLTLDLFNCSAEELIGCDDTRFFPPDTVKRLLKIDSRVLNGETTTEEIDAFDEKGKGSYYLEVKSPIFAEQNSKKIVGLMGISTDITEHKLAEKKLKESEAYIKTVMDNLPIGLAVNSVDPAVEFNYMNDNFTKYYRTTREALEPQDSFWDVVYEDPVYREQIKRRILDDVASGDPEQMHWYDIPITRKGEKTTFISARNTLLPDTQLMVSTVWDVSERKEAEEKLRKSEEKFRTLFSAVPVPTYTWQQDGDDFVLTNYNASAKTFTEGKIDEFIGVRASEMYRNNEQVLIDLKKCFQEKTTVEREMDYELISTGEKKILSVKYAYVAPDFILVHTVDLTERILVEQEKDDLLQQVQVANERLTALSRELINSQEEERKRISRELHDEFGQALTAITLDLNIIERDLDPKTPQDIKNRLSDTRIIAIELDEKIGELALDLRPSLLDDLGLLPALNWYLERWSKRVEVKVEIERSGKEQRLSPEIETAIYRVVQETLTNVAKHANAKKVCLHLKQGAKAVILNIEDDGIGFDYDEYQNPETPSHGLGLIGMKDRISLIEGQLDIHSKPGEGTRIEIEIPL